MSPYFSKLLNLSINRAANTTHQHLKLPSSNTAVCTSAASHSFCYTKLLFEVSPIFMAPKSPTKIKELMKEKMLLFQAKLLMSSNTVTETLFFKARQSKNSYLT